MSKYRVLSASYVQQMLEEFNLEDFVLHFCCAGMSDIYGPMKGRMDGVVDMQILLRARFEKEVEEERLRQEKIQRRGSL